MKPVGSVWKSAYGEKSYYMILEDPCQMFKPGHDPRSFYYLVLRLDGTSAGRTVTVGVGSAVDSTSKRILCSGLLVKRSR